MPIITRFGGSGGGTPIVCPYPHVWECTVVQSGTVGVVSGVVNLEPYDILHYTMPLGFSTYTLMIGGTTYTTSFLNDGEMYIQWDGNDFVVVAASGGCTYPHVWTSPTYTITGSVLEITGGVDNLATDDIIVLTLASGESASVIEYNSTNYVFDYAVDDQQTYYVMFNGSSFNRLNDPPFNFIGTATSAEVLSGYTFYSNSPSLITGSYVPTPSRPTPVATETQSGSISSLSSVEQTLTLTFSNVNLANSCITLTCLDQYVVVTNVTVDTSLNKVSVSAKASTNRSSTPITVTAYEYDNVVSITRTLANTYPNSQQSINLSSDEYAFLSVIDNIGVASTTVIEYNNYAIKWYLGTSSQYKSCMYYNILEL